MRRVRWRHVGFYVFCALIAAFLFPKISTGLLIQFLPESEAQSLADYLFKNLPTFIGAVTVAFLWDWLKRDYSIELTREQFEKINSLLSEEYKVSPRRRGIEKALREMYSDGDVTNLLDAVAPRKNAYFQSSVTMRLEDDKENSEIAWYTYRISFVQQDNNEYVLAFADSPSLQDKLLNFPRINDSILVHGSILSVGDDANGATLSVAIKIRGVKSSKKLNLRRVSNTQIERYAPGIDTSDHAGIAIFAASVSDFRGANLTLDLPKIRIKKSRRLLFFNSDRPMYINEIDINLQKFDIDRKYKIEVQPFLINTSVALDNFDQNRELTIEINDWMPTGQGFFIVWGDK